MTKAEGGKGVKWWVGDKGSVTIWGALSYLLFYDWLRAEMGGAVDVSVGHVSDKRSP